MAGRFVVVSRLRLCSLCLSHLLIRLVCIYSSRVVEGGDFGRLFWRYISQHGRVVVTEFSLLGPSNWVGSSLYI